MAASAFGIEPVIIHTPEKGYRNTSWHLTLKDNTDCNLIFHKREPGMQSTILRANTAGLLLVNAGVPARVPIDQRILRAKSGTKEQLVALYNYLPGSTIPWEGYTMAHLKLVGKSMGDMHHAWQGRGEGFPEITARLSDLIVRMKEYFSQTGVTTAMRTKLRLAIDVGNISSFGELIKVCEQQPDKQLLHMDFVRGNILFGDGPTLTGIVDFEKVGYGHVLIDVARTLAFLLVDCKYKEEAKIRKYLLISGYKKRSKTTFDSIKYSHNGTNLDVLEQLTNLFLLHDLYKFMRHNPYENLKQNEHYIRTREQLIKRLLITPVV